jgi:CHAT domain-containing protein/Tfp pilus assembly protein PilF
LLLTICTLSCNHRDRSPEAAFENANRAFLRGELKQSQDEAERGYQRFRTSSLEWAWKFRTLEAKAALWRGLFEDVLKLLAPQPPSSQPDLAIPVLGLIGVANAHLRHFSEAERALGDATKLCATSASPSCGDVLQARGLLASEQSRSGAATELYKLTQSFARSHQDRFLESTALLNLGAESLAQGHFDEAIDQSEVAFQIAKTLNARVVELMTQGNIGWAYYKLGDSNKALDLFLQAEKTASELGDLVDQGNWLTNAGYVYMDAHDFPRAEQAFHRAMALEQQVDSKEYIYNAWRVLARLALQTGNLDRATENAESALAIARESGNHLDELYPLLVQGQVSARRGDPATAESTFRKVERDPICPVFLKWEAEHSLALLYEDQKRPAAADREYRAALATFEGARDSIRHEDFHLAFLTNAWRIYDDYVHFLVARGRTNDALRWADYSRARTLAEGLGLLANGTSVGPPALNAQEIARRAKGVLLFYWLGEKQSYLWAITPQKTNLFPLPPGSEIDAAVKRYREDLGGPQDVLVSANEDGRWLYHTLIEPARSLLAAQSSGAKAHALGTAHGTAEAVPFPKSASFENSSKVFVIPDGSLNNLNFETLIVSEPKPHYWIEDATIADASSLRVLAASYATAKKRARRLLLVGNSIPPNDKYPALPKAAVQMESVARHFPAPARQVFSREQATPAAYLASNPEQFSYIHFVAHGTASRLSPLDSAIVLSRGGTETDSFKLYARDILRHRLRAELVTISACYGAGERAYSGEGLVGLSWAFLRAGAHNVIAALWEATDVSTEQLMSKFYDELDQGASPDAALRAAKLSLLQGGVFHNPFYWAPFQLYAGS